MLVLLELPPELILHIMSFLTWEKILDPHHRLAEPIVDFWRGHRGRIQYPQLVPDLPSINALSQANSALHCIVDQILYALCASVEDLGKLALVFAVEHELENTLDRLVEVGINLDAEFLFENARCSLLQIAAGRGLRGMVVKLLGMHGEKMMTRVHARERDHHKTALDYAAQNDHMEVVRLLASIRMPTSGLRDGVPFETHEWYLGRALIESVKYKAGNIEISDYLISEGADINFLDNSENRYGGTPLCYAAGTNHKNLEMVRFLLAAGADPNICNQYGYTPMFSASFHHDLDIVQALLDAGANIHAKCDSCNVLAHCFNVELFRFFLEQGVDPNLEDDEGKTPLHHAAGAYLQDGEISKVSVELLLQFGAVGVDKADRRGHTPVDLAMEKGREDIVKILEPLVQDPNLQARIAEWREKRKGENIG